MPKAGLLHDYDLMANNEAAARDESVICPVCDTSPPSYQWSDYSGQAMCMRCGCPFQLKWGTDEQRAEGKYPYLGMKEEWVPIAREYWQEHNTFVCFGTMLGHAPGLAGFHQWAQVKYPELYEQEPR